MATTRKRPEPVDWEGQYVVEPVDEKVDAMPRRAAGLPSQNGTAMRDVFAYLLDEDDAPPPPSPPAKGKKRR